MAIERLEYGLTTDVKITWDPGWVVTVLRPAFKSIMPWLYVKKQFWLREPVFAIERTDDGSSVD